MILKVRGKVFGSLSRDTITIHIGYGYGMIDGGYLRTVKMCEIPIDCRMPNTYLWVTLQNADILSIEQMTITEIEQNKFD